MFFGDRCHGDRGRGEFQCRSEATLLLGPCLLEKDPHSCHGRGHCIHWLGNGRLRIFRTEWHVLLMFLITSRRLTCIHVKICTLTLADMPFSWSLAGHVWETPDKGTANNDQAHTFCGFLPNPFIQPARNVNREIFLHRQEGFCVGKFDRVVDQAVLENRPLRKHFRRSRLCYKRQGLLKI